MPRRKASDTGPHPFIKWAGGKTQLLAQYEPLYPPAGRIRRYIEPFVGSGAVFFHVRDLLKPTKVILADSNEDLINAYRCVRDDVEALIELLAGHKKAHSEKHYYEVRAQNPRRMSDAGRAARLIYLNKTCFNGLYRVNSSGRFNVPMGRYVDPPILDAENLRRVSAALKGVKLRKAHFRDTLKYADAGDFIYFDPPYQPVSKTSFFTAYTDGAFREEDQEELAAVFAALAMRGCFVMLSNSYSPTIQRLYANFEVRQVRALRAINSKGDSRGRIPEVVTLYYPTRPVSSHGRASATQTPNRPMGRAEATAPIRALKTKRSHSKVKRLGALKPRRTAT